MAIKDQALTVCYVAWNTSTNAGQTGDASNHTLKVVQDGTEGNPTNSPSEVDSTTLKGVYKIALTAGDMNYNCVVLGGASSTANVVIIPVIIVTERGYINTGAAPGASGGILTFGTGAGQVNCDGAGNASANLVNIKGTASAGAAGYVGIDWAHVDNPTSTVALTNTTVETVASVTNAVTANVTEWNGSAVASPNHAGYPLVDLSYILGTASAGAAGYVGIDWAQIHAPTTAQALTGTTIATSQVVASVTAAVSVNLTETLNAARAMDGVADTSRTLNDAFHCAIDSVCAQVDASSGTQIIFKTAATGTTLRTKNLTLISPPSTVPDKAV